MHNQHEIPILTDPAYKGTFIVRNLLSIVALLFLLLGLSVFITTALTRIDISVRANIEAMETCAHDSNQCVTVKLVKAQAKAVNIDDTVYLEVASDQDYRHHLVLGTVVQNDSVTTAIDEALNNKITIKINEADIDKQKIMYAVIIVGKQSAWNALVAALPDII